MGEVVSEDALHKAAYEAAKPSIQEFGRLVLKNLYRLVVTDAKSH